MQKRSLFEKIENEIIDIIRDILDKNYGISRLLDVKLEIPTNREFGHLSTNIAMVLSAEIDKKPLEIAETIKDCIQESSQYFSVIDVVKPGFINLTIDTKVMIDVIDEIWDKGRQFGMSDMGDGKRVQVEFVSANPTGPLNVVNGRAAALGETIVSSLRWLGYDVESEFYINDIGNQIKLLGKSVLAFIKGIDPDSNEFPEQGYRGEYIKDIAEELKNEGLTDISYVAKRAVEIILNWQKKSMKDYGVEFDNWFKQSELEKEGLKQDLIAILERNEALYKKDEALWFNAIKYGDTQDWVLRKSNGEYTYLFYDLLYHLDKYNRGFKKAIDILGPDHHGHMGRMYAGISAMGIDKKWLKIIISQQVNFIEDGERVKMGKRKGYYITLDDLIEDVGVDVAKYFFLDRSPESHLDFDFDKAKEQSLDNPVYYIQYANARICSIFREAEKVGFEEKCIVDGEIFNDDEIDIVFELLYFPKIIRTVAKSAQTQILTDYLYKLSALFHKYYTNYRILGEDREITETRLSLIGAIRRIITLGLYFLGISAPEKM
jgi:arginyl-tRNA synthetase